MVLLRSCGWGLKKVKIHVTLNQYHIIPHNHSTVNDKSIQCLFICRPVCVLPCSEPALAVRWSPVRLAARPKLSSAFPGARRVLAVATRRSLVLYDTQQRTPIALVSNVHYTR